VSGKSVGLVELRRTKHGLSNVGGGAIWESPQRGLGTCSPRGTGVEQRDICGSRPSRSQKNLYLGVESGKNDTLGRGCKVKDISRGFMEEGSGDGNSRGRGSKVEGALTARFEKPVVAERYVWT